MHMHNLRYASWIEAGCWGRQSPVEALLKHVQNPALYNFTTNGVSLPAQAHPLLKCAPARSLLEREGSEGKAPAVQQNYRPVL